MPSPDIEPSTRPVRRGGILSRARRASPNRDRLGTLAESAVVVLDDFLSKAECDQILGELEITLWRPSLTYLKLPAGDYQNLLTHHRISRTAHDGWFSSDLKAILQTIETRLHALFGAEPFHLERWQATDYSRRGKFDYHLDSGYWDDHWAGDRILTFLIYLNTPLKGGGTHFRALDNYVEAKAGRLLVWNNLFDSGDCNARMIHSGTPVRKGRKTTLVTWQRQRKYR